MTPTDLAAVRQQIAPKGTLRVALNLSNFLLVNRGSADDEPSGIAPDVGREIARRLQLPVAFVRFPNPGELAAAVSGGAWIDGPSSGPGAWKPWTLEPRRPRRATTLRP